MKTPGDYTFFGKHKPARSCVEVAILLCDVKVEIETIAIIIRAPYSLFLNLDMV